jgi:hypothetical protein
MRASRNDAIPPRLQRSPVCRAARHTVALESRGWTTCEISAECELHFRRQLLELAAKLGTPTATRTGGNLCDVLLPTKAEAAEPQSLSKIHGFGEFPLHADTAHWLTPCRYLVLACVSPGSASRSTLLLDTRRLPLTDEQTSLLQSTPLRVINGRDSFFSTILSKTRPFVRFDPGCMSPTTPDGAAALAVLARENWPGDIETIRWQAGMVVIIDNWRLLHGRALADLPDPDRKLLRISIR